jgi:predicted molibdopterin-dependent oxidoreductase YjgC
MFIASAKATVEDNYLLMKFAKSIIKSNNLVFLKHIDDAFADNKLKLSDKTPNSTGVTELLKTFPFPGIDAGQLAEKITSGAIKALYVMDEDFEGYSDILSSLSKLDCLIVHAQNSNALTELASAVLPSATFAELEGTYVNFEGRVQHITSALVTAENMRTMGMRMSRLDKFGATNDRWTQHETRMARQSWRIIKDLANIMNAGWKFKTSEDVFNDICTAIPSFAGMTYALLDEFSGIILNRASNPGQVLPVYESHFMKPN